MFFLFSHREVACSNRSDHVAPGLLGINQVIMVFIDTEGHLSIMMHPMEEV